MSIFSSFSSEYSRSYLSSSLSPFPVSLCLSLGHFHGSVASNINLAGLNSFDSRLLSSEIWIRVCYSTLQAQRIVHLYHNITSCLWLYHKKSPTKIKPGTLGQVQQKIRGS
ncbi:unnamed protein product [Choristocarpus tenellus]